MLEPFFDAQENSKRKKIRLIGVRAEKLLRESRPEAARQAIALGTKRDGRAIRPGQWRGDTMAKFETVPLTELKTRLPTKLMPLVEEYTHAARRRGPE